MAAHRIESARAERLFHVLTRIAFFRALEDDIATSARTPRELLEAVNDA